MELYTNKPSSPVAWSVGFHWGWWPDCDPFLDVLLRPYNSIVPFLLKGLVCTVTKRTWRNYDVVEILKRSRRIGRVRSSVYWVVLLNNNKKKEKKRRDGRCFHCDGAFCFSLSHSLSLLIPYGLVLCFLACVFVFFFFNFNLNSIFSFFSFHFIFAPVCFPIPAKWRTRKG